MPEYIEREALVSQLSELEELAFRRAYDTPSSSPAYPRYFAQLTERKALLRRVIDFPAADVAPVKRGEWEPIEDYDGNIHWRCSHCGCEWWFEVGGPSENGSAYCPHCGARMTEGGDHAPD